jgi:hypothetical protein
MPTITITGLQYSNAREGLFRLYIYNRAGYHSGTQWFQRVPEEGEISVQEAMYRTLLAAANGLEVRICDGGDMLVYHCNGANVLYPKPVGDFWKEMLGEVPEEGS